MRLGRACVESAVRPRGPGLGHLPWAGAPAPRRTENCLGSLEKGCIWSLRRFAPHGVRLESPALPSPAKPWVWVQPPSRPHSSLCFQTWTNAA